MVVGLALGVAVAKAQDSPPARTVWDSTYAPAQAESGETTFRYSCTNCHTPVQFTGPSFLGAWQGGTAYELFQLIGEQMPFDNPGSLSREQYTDVLAYLFKLNGFPAGSRPLSSEPQDLKQIRIESKPSQSKESSRPHE